MKLIEPIQEFTSLLLEVSFMPPNEDSNERKLTLSYIENLYNRLFLFPVSERIKDGLIADGWTDEVLKNRLKTARYLLKDWITPNGIAQFETDGLLSTESESMQYVCGKMGARDGSKFMLKVLTLFRCANLDIQMVAKILDEVENLLNPQPDTTTEQEQTIKLHTSLIDDEDIKEVFNAFVEKGYMVLVGNYYHWNKSSHLLAYFCEKVSLYFLNSTKTYDGRDATEWKKFEGIFEIEIKGKLEHPNNDRLRAYKNNWYRGKDRKTTQFLPDGYNGVEDILADLH